MTLVVSKSSLADVTIVRDGVAQSVIHAPDEVMAADQALPAGAAASVTQAETDRRRLRESVNDLALYLGKMSGTQIEVLTTPPQADDGRVPILIGSLAVQRFGGPGKQSPYKQAWRMVVADRGVGLMGESDEATSYAIYEVLDRLGCRWYLPGEMGEVIPQRRTITMPEIDVSDVPATFYRTIWYADEAFKRRNRMGGLNINASHALEFYITKEQREQNPEWRAIVKGKPHEHRLKWSHPGVADAVADAIIAKLDKQYTPTVSLSPDDGMDFDESDDRSWDAGDWDSSLNTVAITDRYIKFINLVVERVTKKYPDVLFGSLAYAQYTRPPLREKPHPNIVTQIASITYCRAHAMTDTHICPSRPQIRHMVEGWGKVSPRLSYYNYMFHLAETSVPYPMMHQMSEELPIIYANNIKFWQPETMPNFESVLPGMVLTIRKSWYTQAKSKQILDEFFTRFYGNASTPMRRYWQRFDDAWTKHPEHSGSHLSYVQRFTPQIMIAARADINAAKAACRTDLERQRVQLQDDALKQFELYMKMRHDLLEGRLTNLDRDGARWIKTQLDLGEAYSANYAFTKLSFAPHNFGTHYFKTFLEATYNDAGRIARDFNIITPPLRNWHYMADKDKKGEALGWNKPEYDVRDWKTTNVGVDTWYTLGLENYYGSVWYRHTARTQDLPTNKKTYLWVSSSDGNLKLLVNGQHIPYVNEKGEKLDEYSGFSQPASFDITSALMPNADNQITIVSTRPFLNELGSGGLLAPVYLYQEK